MKIAVSSLSGAGTSTVCRLVARRLKLKAVNYTFRDMARKIGMDFEQLHRERKEDEGYDYLLDKKQMDLFEREKNAIIGSRLAIWLADANLKVWLDAGLRVRADRIAERESIGIKEALHRTQQRDRENAAQYKRLYGIDVMGHGFADLITDTEKNSAKKVAEKIISEARKAEYSKIRKSSYKKGILEKIQAGLKKSRC